MEGLRRQPMSCVRGIMSIFGVTLLASLAGAGDFEFCGEQLTTTEDCPINRGCYAGVLVGGAVSANDSILQSGIAFQVPPLDVQAAGDARSRAGVMAGINLGYEGRGRSVADGQWAILPAAEFEGYYLGTVQNGILNNPTPRIPGHSFDLHAPLDIGVLMPNIVLTLHTPYRAHPYIGGGVGAAVVSNSGAFSEQLIRPEPGINHFNSDPNASDWAVATTARAGVRFDVGRAWYLFAEYKFLSIGVTNYTFGPTVFPGHVPTTSWSVRYGSMFEHMGVVGIGRSF